MVLYGNLYKSNLRFTHFLHFVSATYLLCNPHFSNCIMATKTDIVKHTNERFYKDVIESLEDYCVFATDEEGRLTSWNIGAQNITGYTAAEVIGQKTDIFFIAADVEAGMPAKELKIAKAEGRSVNERWHVKKDKTIFWGSGLAFPLKDETDQFYGFIKVMRDQTAQVKMTQALKNEQSKLELIFEKAPAFLIVFRGPHFTIERVNETFIIISGKKDLKGKSLPDVLPEIKNQEFLIHLSEVMKTGEPYFGKEIKMIFEQGSGAAPREAYLNLVYQPDLDTDDKITGVIVHGYEVTDQIRARQYMEKAAEAQAALQQQKEEFLGIASHELKTPVTSLKAYSQFVESTLRKDGLVQQAALVGKMSNQINRLQNLISDLLDVTKVNAGKLQFNEAYFDFEQMLQDVIEDLQRITKTHEIITRIQPVGQVWADRFRISQVLTNFITNAVKYSPDSREIIVSSSLVNSEVQVSVEDFGIGISDQHKEHLFSRFYRVSGVHENIFTGLGLGLYISAEIIKQEGGRVWVTSEKGKGSVFCFSLPVDRHLEQP